jgi:predicted CoA-binding protein
VFPLHPSGGGKDGVKFYSDFDELPEKPDACIVCSNMKKNKGILPELAASGAKQFWFQWGSYDNAVLEEARKLNIIPFTGCVMMYLPDASFLHRFHRFLYELFSKGKT